MLHAFLNQRWFYAILFTLGATQLSAATGLDTARIEQLTNLKGTFSKEENVFKVSKPRTDFKINIDNLPMAPFMGLTSWAAFTPITDSKIMLMGDFVLFEDEVNQAMSAALDAGLEVTALHNHFFFDQPRVYFMHIGGTGTTEQLAAGVKKILDEIAEIRRVRPTPVTEFPGRIADKSAINPAPLEAALGVKGQANDGMFKVVIGRSATMHGISVGKEMGVNTWAAFAGSDEQAVVDGDFAILGDELQPVLKAMRASGIHIVAVHQHMTHEEPRYFFLHYWGKGKALDLAKAVRQALEVSENKKVK
ncbi:MAG: DUF1259 domain-containing protein [Betaproteobacteria bacterium]|nr:DUF1259 domain-containing protein [Betaproteobacteria bacterium]